MRNIFLVGFLVCYYTSFSQQLIINEVSQGTGSAEYVEFVVVGSTICENDPIPCIDLRKVIFDDNNGYFESNPSGGVGIAPGAIRFSNDVFWSCIPQGTYILIYNQAEPNPLLPADDISTIDGNCYLVLPANSPLLESTSVSPNNTVSTYPPDPQWGPSTGWTSIGMANGGDSFMIPDLTNNGTPLYGVSWGTNSSNSIIYFTGSATGLVMSFKNIVDNNPNNQANWVSESQANGTPGLPNSTANDIWIGTMNPTCRQNALLDLNATNTSCGGSNGSATVVVNGITNYTIEWETGSNAATINNLAAGYYTVTVTDNSNGCEVIDSVEVLNNAGTLAVNLTMSPENCIGSCDGNISVNISGGTAPYTQTWTLNGNQISIPTANEFCAGNYEVSVEDNNGCEATEVSAVTTSPSTLNIDLQMTPESCTGACNGNIIANISGGASPYSTELSYNGNPIALPLPNEFCGGSYEFTITDANGCEANETISISTSNSLTMDMTPIAESCLGNCDGNIVVNIFGASTPLSFAWTFEGAIIPIPDTDAFCSGNYSLTTTDGNGCQVTESAFVSTTAPPAVEVSNDTIICIRDTISLFAIGGPDIQWSTGESTAVIEISPLETSNYSVVITSGACVVNENVVVQVKNCDTDHTIEFPNIFSPDGDNVNDYFIPIKWINVENISFTILNRWGNEMFETSAAAISWDGENAVEGTYFYVLDYEDGVGNEYQLHGCFQLVR